jgi:hypothetical protein
LAEERKTGGDNISVSVGVVSRVEPQQYVHGAASLLAIQVAIFFFKGRFFFCSRHPNVFAYVCMPASTPLTHNHCKREGIDELYVKKP